MPQIFTGVASANAQHDTATGDYYRPMTDFAMTVTAGPEPAVASRARVVVVREHAEAGELAADVIATALELARTQRRAAVLGFATGSTPLPLYTALAARHLDLSGAWGFALDEYVGLPGNHPESYEAVIEREVVVPLGLNRARVRIPGGTGEVSANPNDRAALDAQCVAFERAIDEAGGIDVQVLGIGSNGHIAFNEPGSPLDSLTRVVELTEQTRRDNSRFFTSVDEVPTHAVTQGLGTISRARSVVLLAFGEHKAEAIAATLEGPVCEAAPASIIQRHPDALVILDEAAASRLSGRAISSD